MWCNIYLSYTEDNAFDLKKVSSSWRFHENSHATTKLETWICQIRNWSSMKNKMAEDLKTVVRKLDIYST